jgi:UDP-N-acetylmuramate--alanine ligase
MTALAPLRAAHAVPLAPTNPRPTPLDLAGRQVYFVGIGGSGMSGLARLFRARGATVRGSDASPQESTDALRAEGVTIDLDQSRAWLPEVCDLVVATAAIRPDHPQMLAARERGIRTLSYAQALGQCLAARTGVCVAGTHGKSTTTAMLGCVLAEAGLDPSVIVGATCRQLAPAGGAGGAGGGGGGSGFRLGKSTVPAGPYSGKPGLLVAESCEFDRSFHNYFPVLAAITAVEADHLDIYGSLDAVIESFGIFARQVAPASEGGRLLIAHEGAHRREVTAGVSAKVETIGYVPEADWVLSFDPASRRATLRHGGKVVCGWTCQLPGAHNAMNGATAAALATMLGAAPEAIERALSAFRGVDRRTQVLGTRTLPNGATIKVYDDYGHHPTEVDATLRALREFERLSRRPDGAATSAGGAAANAGGAGGVGSGRLICVFQPHQHSRTRHLMDEFVSAFAAADLVIVPEIYFVRDSEHEKHLVSAGDLVDRLRAKGVQAMHLHPFEAIVEALEQLGRPGDLLVVMGAGPVWKIGQRFVDRGTRA